MPHEVISVVPDIFLASFRNKFSVFFFPPLFKKRSCWVSPVRVTGGGGSREADICRERRKNKMSEPVTSTERMFLFDEVAGISSAILQNVTILSSLKIIYFISLSLYSQKRTNSACGFGVKVAVLSLSVSLKQTDAVTSSTQLAGLLLSMMSLTSTSCTAG